MPPEVGALRQPIKVVFCSHDESERDDAQIGGFVTPHKHFAIILQIRYAGTIAGPF
jgi:hypothetical protein